MSNMKNLHRICLDCYEITPYPSFIDAGSGDTAMDSLGKAIQAKAMIESASSNVEIIHSMSPAMTSDEIKLLTTHAVECLERAIAVLKCEYP